MINQKINKLINYVKFIYINYSITIVAILFLYFWFYFVQGLLTDYNIITGDFFYSDGYNILKNLIAQLSHSDIDHLRANVTSLLILLILLETIIIKKEKIKYVLIFNTIILSVVLYSTIYIDNIDSFIGFSAVINSLIPITVYYIIRKRKNINTTKEYILINIFIIMLLLGSFVEFYFLYFELLTQENYLSSIGSSIGHFIGFTVGLITFIIFKTCNNFKKYILVYYNIKT